MIIRDGSWSLFDYDFQTGRQVWHMRNPDGSETYRTDYRVDDVLDANQAARSEAAGKRHGDWSRIASIPLGAYYGDGLNRAQAQMDAKYFDKYLSEYSKFRTR
jgi:hypothetical protein